MGLVRTFCDSLVQDTSAGEWSSPQNMAVLFLVNQGKSIGSPMNHGPVGGRLLNLLGECIESPRDLERMLSVGLRILSWA
jgi:hypothetical protein